MNEQEHARFKAAVDEFDWLGTIVDDAYCDHVHPALMEGVFTTADGLDISLSDTDEVDVQRCFDAANESFLRFLLGKVPPHEVECPGCGKPIRFRCVDGNHQFE